VIIVALRLFGLGVPPWMTPLVKWLIDIGLVLAFLGGLWALHSHWTHKAYNNAFNEGWRALSAKYDAEAERARKVNETALQHTDTERAADTKKITDDKGKRDDAIKGAAPSATGDATRSLGCVRWRNAHPGATSVPAGC